MQRLNNSARRRLGRLAVLVASQLRATMLSSLAILSADRGTTVFEKHWRDAIHRSVLDELWAALEAAGGCGAAPPVQSVGRHVFVLAVRGPLLLVGALAREVPSLLVLELLHRVGDLLQLYLRELTEEAIRGNFVTVCQLLDEVIDNGAPLHTEPSALQELVMRPDRIKSMVASVTGASQVRGVLPDATSLAPWRRAGVRSTANELYLDLLERLDATVENGLLQRAETRGEAVCSCQLSGMPSLTLSFNSAHLAEDVALHNCVQRQRWERERQLGFIPPDGLFTLLSYGTHRISCVPVYLSPQLRLTDAEPAPGAGPPGSAGSRAGEGGGGAGSLSVTLGSRPGPAGERPIDDVVVTIPFPPGTSSASFSASFGAVGFDERTAEATWTVGKLPKDKTPTLTGSFRLPSGRPTRGLSLSLFVHFRAMLHSCSGLKVASLLLENEETQPFKGVRAITSAGTVEVRT